MIARDGREVLLEADRISRGGFVIEAVPKPGEFSLPAGQRLRLESAGKTIDAIVPEDGSKQLWVQDPAQAGGLAEGRLAGGAGRASRSAGATACCFPAVTREPIWSIRSPARAVPSRSCPSSTETIKEAGCRRRAVDQGDGGAGRRRRAYLSGGAKTVAGAAVGRRGDDDASAADHGRPGLDRGRRDRRDGRPARPGAVPPAT